MLEHGTQKKTYLFPALILNHNRRGLQQFRRKRLTISRQAKPRPLLC